MIVTRRPLLKPTLNLLLGSDHQIGSAQNDEVFMKWELEKAKAIGARIALNGDLFDALLPGDRKRFVPNVLHDELVGKNDIINHAIGMAYKLFAPYAHLIDVIGIGNHDHSVVKIHSYDPVKDLVARLNTLPGANINYGGYCGFLIYEYADRPVLTIQYHHGAGGAAPVTKGLIDFHRTDSWVQGAHVTWKGHKHNKVYYRDAALTPKGLIPRMHIMTGAYMDIYREQTQEDIMENGRQSEWESDSFFAPQGKGGFFLNLQVNGNYCLLRVEDDVSYFA